MTLIYLSGPMTGLPEENYPAFRAAAARLRALGYHVLNPAETAGGETKIDRSTFMAIDAGYVSAADIIVLMEGWQRSKGSKCELILAVGQDKPAFLYCPIGGIGAQVIVENWGVQYVEHDWRRPRPEVTTTEQQPAVERQDPKIIPMFSGSPSEDS